ncbi:MAG: hypothetical protein Kow0022_16930 [Phycisphaerales bacterium]
MDPSTRQKVLAGLACVLLLGSGVLIVRALTPSASSKGGELDERTRRGLGAAGALLKSDAAGLPERGDMTDEEYARYLIQLRDDADRAAAGESAPGSARESGG